MKMISKPVKKLLSGSFVGLFILFILVAIALVMTETSAEDINALNPIERFAYFRYFIYGLLLISWSVLVSFLIKRKYHNLENREKKIDNDNGYTIGQIGDMQAKEIEKLLSMRIKCWLVGWILFVEVFIIRQGQGVFY